MMIGDRQRHRHLAIGLLAELSAILMMHPDRMLTFLGKRRIVDDPGFDRSLPRHRWRHQISHLGQHLLVRPFRIGNEMQQLLMLCRNPRRRRHRRHRFDALALNRHQQAQAVVMHRLLPISMTQHGCESLDIGRKARFTRLA
jgi:hypothetical protein